MKFSSLEGVVVAIDNVIVLKTNPSGICSSRITFLAKREC